MECPACQASLVRGKTAHGFVYLCRRCGGRSVTLPVLRKAGAAGEFLADVWRRSQSQSAGRVRPCPHCGRPMAQVSTLAAGESLTLDVCRRCPAIWFDRSEFESIPPEPPPSRRSPEMSPAAREQVALLELQRVKRRQQDESAVFGPEEAWQWLPGLLGLPVELDAPRVSQIPWVTWSTIVLCVLATLLTLGGGAPPPGGVPLPTGVSPAGDVIHRWGFIPAEGYRYGGLTLITSFFLHAGIWHLLGNMYFLFIFGDNVEDRLGRARYVALLGLAHAAGMLAHGLFDPRPDMPCVGASAGISGVIAYYAVAYPNARLGFMFRYFLYFRWIRLSAVWALVLYVLMQLLGAYSQVKGFGSVSFLGHLGGLAVGLGAAFLHERRRQQQAASTMRPAAKP